MNAAAVAVRKGMRFEHARQFDTTWTPGPGQRYADAPKAIMEITRVATGTAWYRPVGSTGHGFRSATAEMIEGGGVVGRWLTDDESTGPRPRRTR